MDKIIVRRNVERFATEHKLDEDYLLSLSDDAVPELIALINEMDNNDMIHEGMIKKHLEMVLSVHEERNIIEYNIRHNRAYQVAKEALTMFEDD